MPDRPMTLHTCCPILSRRMNLARWVDAPDPEQPRIFTRFEKDIHWLYETESQMVFTYRGLVVDDGDIYGDFYGFRTSFCEDSLESASARGNKYGVEPPANVIVRTRLIQTPVKLEPEERYAIPRRVAYSSLVRQGLTTFRDDDDFDLLRRYVTCKASEEEAEAFSFDEHSLQRIEGEWQTVWQYASPITLEAAQLRMIELFPLPEGAEVSNA